MPSQVDSSDAQLVRAVLDGRKEAYRHLVRRYQEVLYRHAERMVGGRDEAADIVQRTFVRGYRKLRWCRDPERVGGWLFRINANLCKDYLKNRRRDDVPLAGAPDLRSTRWNPDEAIERSELRASLESALGKLSAEGREAFVLKHVEGRSYAEMSELLDVSVSALKMRVHRAREELQELLEEYR